MSVDIATTLSEIADVRVWIHSSPPPEREGTLRTCVEDAVWDTAVTVPPQIRIGATTIGFARN